MEDNFPFFFFLFLTHQDTQLFIARRKTEVDLLLVLLVNTRLTPSRVKNLEVAYESLQYKT